MMWNKRSGLLAATLALTALTACGSDSDKKPGDPRAGVNPAPPGAPWETLSEWRLFDDIEQQKPAKGVIHFEVNSVLFADEADKIRFLWLPENQKIAYKDVDRWDFPVGSILVKTFMYPHDARDPAMGRRLLETRLLVREPDVWAAYIYVYTDSQANAEERSAGPTLPVTRIDQTGATREDRYNVPSEFECQSCHGTLPEMYPLGPRTRQLDRVNDYGDGPENQIDYLAKLGLLDVSPPAERQRLTDPYGDGPIAERARSYLDANCGHCHSPERKADSTGFYVDYDSTDPVRGNRLHWGECKFPTSAGHAGGDLKYDIVPGNPEQSILVHRVASIEPDVKMPPLPTRLADAQGVQVMRDWIASMTPRSCD
ncbi:MAG TPA: c-type cytochrome domain-containing protein [Polyangiaceae bacterium]